MTQKVRPIINSLSNQPYRCGKCGMLIDKNRRKCKWCGFRVDWKNREAVHLAPEMPTPPKMPISPTLPIKVQR